MRILHRVWLQRLAFDRLYAWSKAMAAARVVRKALASALLRGAWVSWRDVVALGGRIRTFRGAWYVGGALCCSLHIV